jgi:hypothetical protein
VKQKTALRKSQDAMDTEEDEVKKVDNRWSVYESFQCEESLWLFTKQNPLRRFCYTVSSHDHFEDVILVLIVASSLKLALDTYV